ncbi:MAG: LPS export ABC transporter periplasmic protein LptC [bacterium]
MENKGINFYLRTVIGMCPIAILGFCLLLFLLISCQEKGSNTLYKNGEKPKQVIKEFTMANREGGKKVWVLTAAKARLYEQSSVALLEMPSIRFFEEDKEGSMVSAKSGKVDQDKNEIIMWGDVVIDSKKEGTVIKTEEVYYDIEKKQIYSDKPVSIIRHNMITNGVGFESDVGLQVIEIKDNITEISNEK